MSLHEYLKSQDIARLDFPFYSLIMAAMRQADTINFDKLKLAFPETAKEMQARYNAPGGLLGGE
jgi:hypothetical protein